MYINLHYGITLIALIITIILLLILAGVTISLTLGENGILKLAEQSTEEQKIAEYQEKIDLSRVKALGNNNGTITIDNLISQIYNDNIVTEGSIKKIDEEKAELTTKEGYKFIITTSKIEHKEKPISIPLGDIELFTKMEENGYTINDLYRYGARVSRSGYNEYGGMNQLHSLGIGSGSGINTNTVTLTIDFDTLAAKYKMNKNPKGISTDCRLEAGTYSGYTSWAEAKMVVIYEDGGKDEVSGERLVACNKDAGLDSNLTLNFDENKKVKEIQIIITMYDSDCGSALGYIKNITILEAMSKTNTEFNEEETIELFKKMEKNAYTIDDLYRYGIKVDRSGYNQYSHNALYNLGMGSSSGINTNTFTLTMDFNTLAAKFGITKDARGISTNIHHYASADSGYTSWIESKIIVTYEDQEKDEVSSQRYSAYNKTINLDNTLTLDFNKDKKPKEIQIIVKMYDSDYGAAEGYIKSINILD